MISDWFNTYFKRPEIPIEGSKIFTPEHLILSTIIIITFFIVIFAFRNRSESAKGKLLFVSAIIILLLEIFRISYKMIYYGFDNHIFAFNSCAQMTLYIPLALFIKRKWMYDFIFVPALIGGVGAMIYPMWVFNNYPVFHVFPVQSMITHGFLWFIPIFLITVGRFTPELNNIKFSILAGIWIAFVATLMSYINNANYTLMRSAEGIPFIEEFQNPSHIFVMILIYIFITFLFYLPFEIYYLIRRRLTVNKEKIEVNFKIRK